MNFLNNLGKNNIHKLDKHAPFLHFTTDFFERAKILYENNNNADPAILSKSIKIDLIKYSFIIGTYSKAFTYLKQLLIDSGREYLVPELSILMISTRKDENYIGSYTKAQMLNLISRLYWYDSGVSFNEGISKRAILNTFYKHVRDDVTLNNYKIWVIITISTYLDHIKDQDFVDGNRYHVMYFSEYEYQYLREKLASFFEDMMQRGLFYVLDCYGILNKPSLYFRKTLEIMCKNKICYNSLKRCITVAQKLIIDNPNQKNVMIDYVRTIYSFFELVNSGDKILLSRLMTFIINARQSELIIFCLGINFSMSNTNKIEIREKSTMFYHNVVFYFKYPFVGRQFFKTRFPTIMLRKLSKLKNKYPIIEISNVLNRRYDELIVHYKWGTITNDIVNPTNEIDYNTTNIKSFINECHNLLVIDQQYQPQGDGYIDVKREYESRILLGSQ